MLNASEKTVKQRKITAPSRQWQRPQPKTTATYSGGRRHPRLGKREAAAAIVAAIVPVVAAVAVASVVVAEVEAVAAVASVNDALARQWQRQCGAAEDAVEVSQ
jgi:hypothetical protein